MLAVMALFLVGMMTGSRSEKPLFWQLAGLTLVVFVTICVTWHYANGWPGLFSSAFAAQLGKWVVTTVTGIMVGAILFAGVIKKSP